MLPERPVCTCITRTMPTLLGEARVVRVFDPFCQLPPHRAAGSTDVEPTYPAKKEGGNG